MSPVATGYVTSMQAPQNRPSMHSKPTQALNEYHLGMQIDPCKISGVWGRLASTFGVLPPYAVSELKISSISFQMRLRFRNPSGKSSNTFPGWWIAVRANFRVSCSQSQLSSTPSCPFSSDLSFSATSSTSRFQSQGKIVPCRRPVRQWEGASLYVHCCGGSEKGESCCKMFERSSGGRGVESGIRGALEDDG